jgi:hypothetical protein
LDERETRLSFPLMHTTHAFETRFPGAATEESEGEKAVGKELADTLMCSYIYVRLQTGCLHAMGLATSGLYS